MLVDLSPLRHRDFRLVFVGQFVSAIGSLLTYVALPVAVYGLTVMSVFSGWTKRVRRHGAAVVIAAAVFGACITALGFARSLPVAFACLVLAGAADMVAAFSG